MLLSNVEILFLNFLKCRLDNNLVVFEKFPSLINFNQILIWKRLKYDSIIGSIEGFVVECKCQEDNEINLLYYFTNKRAVILLK